MFNEWINTIRKNLLQIIRKYSEHHARAISGSLLSAYNMPLQKGTVILLLARKHRQVSCVVHISAEQLTTTQSLQHCLLYPPTACLPSPHFLFQGGRFYFYEHVAEFNTEQHGPRRKTQEILSELGIWPFFFGGCMMNRDMLEDIKKAGFSRVQAQRWYAPHKKLLLQVIEPSLMGVAEK